MQGRSVTDWMGWARLVTFDTKMVIILDVIGGDDKTNRSPLFAYDIRSVQRRRMSGVGADVGAVGLGGGGIVQLDDVFGVTVLGGGGEVEAAGEGAAHSLRF